MNADEKWTRKNGATRDQMAHNDFRHQLFFFRLMHTGVMDLTHSGTFTFALNVFITFIFIQRAHWLIRWIAVWMWQCPKFLRFSLKNAGKKSLCTQIPILCVCETFFPFVSSAHVNISLLLSKSIFSLNLLLGATAIMIATFCVWMLSSFNPLWYSIPFETFTVFGALRVWVRVEQL